MSEVIIITIIICFTMVFMLFVYESVDLSKHKLTVEHKYKLNDGDHDFIEREEFEEYEEIVRKSLVLVNERIDKLEENK